MSSLLQGFSETGKLKQVNLRDERKALAGDSNEKENRRAKLEMGKQVKPLAWRKKDEQASNLIRKETSYDAS